MLEYRLFAQTLACNSIAYTFVLEETNRRGKVGMVGNTFLLQQESPSTSRFQERPPKTVHHTGYRNSIDPYS